MPNGWMHSVCPDDLMFASECEDAERSLGQGPTNFCLTTIKAPNGAVPKVFVLWIIQFLIIVLSLITTKKVQKQDQFSAEAETATFQYFRIFALSDNLIFHARTLFFPSKKNHPVFKTHVRCNRGHKFFFLL